MNKKVLIYVLVGVIIILTVCICLLVINKGNKEIITHIHHTTYVKETTPQTKDVSQPQNKNEITLYSSETDLPFVTLFDISKLNKTEQEKAGKIISDYQSSYITKFNNKTQKFLVITPDKLSNRSVYDRHNLEILEVTLNNGGPHTLTIGFSGLDGETAHSVEGFKTDNETWEFDRTTEIARPLKHLVHNNEGTTEYEETWNYNEKEPVKYEMKNGEGRTISVLKETVTGETTYNQEHIFYDDAGQTDMIVSIHYEGANVTRLTYYNINDKENSFTIINEYTDGVKTSEKIYNSDYALISDIKAEYTDGQISQLELMKNNQEKEVIRKP